MKRFLDRFFTAVVVLVMIFLLGATIIQKHEPYSYWENRNLAEFPVPKAESVMNGTWFTKLEKYFCDHAAWREAILPADTQLNLDYFHRPVVNDIVVGDGNLLLPYRKHEVVDQESIKKQAEKLTRNLGFLTDLTESYGGTYCYVAVPCQYACFSNQYPFYLNNRAEYTDVSREVLEESLAEKGVPYLDLGPAFDRAGSPGDIYSTVDNHFSMEGAYEAYRVILQELNRLASSSDRAVRPDDRRQETENSSESQPADYPQLRVLQKDELIFSEVDAYYMGSRTRKLFNFIQNNEKLYVAEPIEPIPFERYDYGHKKPDLPRIYVYPQEGDPVTYSGLYMGGDISITRIETNRPELPTVLIYGDSFTNPVECLLYLSCDTMYSVDMRYYDDSTLADLILEIKPDFVFCLRDYESLLSTSGNGGK